MPFARKLLLSVRNQIPPWRERATRAAIKDVEAERSLARARTANQLAVEAIRDAYRLADDRIRIGT